MQERSLLYSVHCHTEATVLSRAAHFHHAIEFSVNLIQNQDGTDCTSCNFTRLTSICAAKKMFQNICYAILQTVYIGL
jgi:hypothetical protein